jgi:hypothetical protein
MTAPFLTPRMIPKIGLATIIISMIQCQIENDSIIAAVKNDVCFPYRGRWLYVYENTP